MSWVDDRAVESARMPILPTSGQRPGLWRGRYRSLPHRAHVLRRRSHRCDGRDDSGREHGSSCQGARQAAALSAPRFHRHLQSLNGLPATIRFLDPPLHEFLPHDKAQQLDLAKKLGMPVGADFEPRASSCTRSIRCSAIAVAGWGSFIPEISEMQARAVFEAAPKCKRKASKCGLKS